MSSAAVGRPPVSVVIPAYNAERTLERALRSVAAQAYAPLEVIVVDDGSADATARVAEAFEPIRARLIRHEHNRGSPAALNTAIAAASHDLVAFLDADDEWLPGKIDRQVATFATHPDTVMVPTAFEMRATDGTLLEVFGDAPFRHPPEEFWRELLLMSAIAKPTVMTRRSSLLAVGGFDEALPIAEDQDMWIRLAARGAVRYLPEVLVRCHATPGSLGGRYRRYDRRFVLPMIRRNLARLGPRLTPAERRAVLTRRYRAAASNALNDRDPLVFLWACAGALVHGGLRRPLPI